MISTLSPRIVFVGDNRGLCEKWKYLDDPKTNELDLYQFNNSHKNLKRVDIYSRFIDSSEFVVRCEKFRTLSGASVDISFGKKTDAVVGPHFDLQIVTEKKEFKKGKRPHDHSIEVLMPGTIYSYVSRPSANMNPGQIHKFSNISGHAISSSYNPEIWFPIARTLSSMFEGGSFRNWLFEKHYKDVSFDEILSSYNVGNIAKKFYSNYSKHNNLSYKFADAQSVSKLHDECDKVSLTYKEMEEKWNGIPWWESLKKKSNHRLDYYKEKHKYPYMYGCHIPISRGIEAVWLAMNDSRFHDYDFYTIGYSGISQSFRHLPFFQQLQINEYLLWSKWLKEGKIKHLPESLDEENYRYEKNVIENKIYIDGK